MKKRLLAALMAGAMALTMTACGGSKSDAGNNAAAGSEASGETGSAEGKQVLSVTTWDNESTPQFQAVIDAYEEMLEKTKHDILSSDADALLQDFQSAKDYRDSIAITNKGPIKEIYELYLDLLDEAGGIATVATILASNHLSIKNIGIIHNREFEDGVLRLEMYDRISLDAAVQLLRKHHYTIYER